MEPTKRFVGSVQVISEAPLNAQPMILINSYVNNVSGCGTDQAPPDFRGGLLADEMGLGKTLSMICLIAADKTPPAHSLSSMSPGTLNSRPTNVMKTTLLIVPPPCMCKYGMYYSVTNMRTVIQAWEKQLSLYVS